MPCYLTFKISPICSVTRSELVPVLDTHPAEVKSHPGGDGPADRAQFAAVHRQPVLVGGGAVEVVFQLCWERSLWLVAVQPTPVLIAAAEQNKCTNQLAKALHGSLISAVLLRYHLILHGGIIYQGTTGVCGFQTSDIL